MRIPRELKEEYAARRAKAFAQRDVRVEALYARSPRLREIDEARQEAIYDRGLARISGLGMEEATARLARLDEERASLLLSLGENDGVYAPVFSCSLCGDTGYVGSEEKTLCACLRQRIVAENFKSANLPASDCFENFCEDIYPDEKQKKQSCKLRDICLSYAQSFPSEGVKGIVILGASGLGKTFLLRCVAHRVLERGYSVADLTSYGLMRDVMQRIQKHEGAADYTEADLLILDDLGSEPAYGPVTVQTLFSILNERQNLGKPTLMATNLSTEQLLALYGERLYSRIVAPRLNSLYMLKGGDLRTQPLSRGISC